MLIDADGSRNSRACSSVRPQWLLCAFVALSVVASGCIEFADSVLDPPQTPTVAGSQTPTPSQTDLIANGGFESTLAGTWTLSGNAPTRSTVQVHTGSSSLLLTGSGASADGGLCGGLGSCAVQTVSIPASATSAVLSFEYWTDGGQQLAGIYEGSGNLVVNIFTLQDSSQAWLGSTTDLSAYLPANSGQQFSPITISFSVDASGIMFIDDVSLIVQ